MTEPPKKKGNPAWVKGVSGNPRGPAKNTYSVSDNVELLAKRKTQLALRTLANICNNSKDDRAKVIAAQEILNRGWGRIRNAESDNKATAFVEMLRTLNARPRDVVDIGPIQEDPKGAESGNGTGDLSPYGRASQYAAEIEEIRIGIRDGNAGSESRAVAETSASDDIG